jgi:hypothetical protein
VNRHLGETESFRGQQARVSTDDYAVLVNDDRNTPTKLFDGAATFSIARSGTLRAFFAYGVTRSICHISTFIASVWSSTPGSRIAPRYQSQQSFVNSRAKQVHRRDSEGLRDGLVPI